MGETLTGRPRRRHPAGWIAPIALVAVLAAVPVPVRAATTTLGPVANDTPLSAYGGWVLWSEMRPDGRWALTAWHDGARTRLRVRTRATPFDVDLGPDASGRPVALYSRCAKDPVTSWGGQRPRDFYAPTGVPEWAQGVRCRLRRLDLETGTETALSVPGSAAGSDATPSQWRGRIAFSRRPAGAHLTRVLLWSPASDRIRRLRSGDLPRSCPFRGGCKGQRFDGDVMQLDLGSRALGMSWVVQAPAIYGVGVGRAVYVDGLSGTTRELVSFGIASGACGGLNPGSPNVAGTGAWFWEYTYDCEVVRTYAAFGDGHSHGHVASDPDRLVWELARDGDHLYAVEGGPVQPTAPDSIPCIGAGGPCRLTVQPLPRGQLTLLPGRGASEQF